MADMQRARHVGRRVDDRPRLRAGALGAELAARFPMGIPAGFDCGGVEGLGKLGHGAEPLAGEAPKREGRAESIAFRLVFGRDRAEFRTRRTISPTGTTHAASY